LERVITGDESWIYEYDIKLKLQIMETSEVSKTEKSKEKQIENQKSSSLFSLTVMELFTTNLYLRVKLPTQLSMWRF
jgi:hypothetical protein